MTQEKSQTKSGSKPSFVVKESNFSARVKARWRFPRGKHSAVRQMHRGRPTMPSVGFGRPSTQKNLHKSGLLPVVVANAAQLLALDPNTQGAVIASSVGMRKARSLFELATEKKIAILNVKDPQVSITKIDDALAARKSARATKMGERSAKEKETKKKAKEAKEKEETQETEQSVEEKIEKEEAQKKQIEKELTKRQ